MNDQYLSVLTQIEADLRHRVQSALQIPPQKMSMRFISSKNAIQNCPKSRFIELG